MDSRETANLLLAECAQREGIASLALDDDNYCALVSPEEDVIHLRLDADNQTFLILGVVGSLPAEDDLKAVRVMRALLASNLFWLDTLGATLAVENDENVVILQHSWRLENGNAEQLCMFIKQFAEMLSFWKERYQELGDEVMDDIQPFYLKV